MATFHKTMVVWRRLGKEHGEHQGFQLNPPQVVERHLLTKLEQFRACPPSDWRWWQVADDFVMEKPPTDVGIKPTSVTYYLPEQGWTIMEDVAFPGLAPDWFWYVHISQLDFSEKYRAWIMTDLFADMLIARDGHRHTVMDLDELADAEQMHLITVAQLRMALQSCQKLINLINQREFPPTEIRQSMGYLQSLGWR